MSRHVPLGSAPAPGPEKRDPDSPHEAERPVGAGPSGKMCPRWASQVAQRTSTRFMPSERSSMYSTRSSARGA